MWVSTSYGIYKLNKEKLTATSYGAVELNQKTPVWYFCTKMFMTREGHLLCGIWNAGYLIFDETKDSFITDNRDGHFLSNTTVFNFAQLNSTIFFAGPNGLFSCTEKDLYDLGFKSYNHYPSDSDVDPSDIISNSFNAILVDSVDNLWL